MNETLRQITLCEEIELSLYERWERMGLNDPSEYALLNKIKECRERIDLLKIKYKQARIKTLGFLRTTNKRRRRIKC